MSGSTLIDATLVLAKLCGIVYEGIATGGNTLTLADSEHSMTSEKFAGGTIWILSGTYDGSCMVITQSANRTFTWETALAGDIITGVYYAVSLNKFTKQALKQAINFVLGRTDIVKIDDTTVITDTDEYTLPSGVNNIKKVFIASETSAPWGWVENNYWREIAGKLIFSAGNVPSDTGKIIRLVYKGKHGAIDETGDNSTLDDSLNEEYILWSAAKHLWRTRITLMGKDDPLAFDFFNEAIQEAANEAAKGKSINITKAVRHTGF